MEKEKTAKVELHGRELEVRAPTAEQVMMVNRMTSQVKSRGSANGLEALELLDQSFMVVESVLVSDDDVIWIKRQMLTGKLTLTEAATVVSGAITKLWPKASPKDHLKKSTKANLVKE